MAILNNEKTYFQQQNTKSIYTVKFTAQLILLTSCLVFNVSAIAESMSKNQYELQDKKLEAEYESAKNRCDTLKGNVNDICIAKAKGRRSVAKAELKARFNPTLENRVDMRIAMAEADYVVAVEECDNIEDNALCISRAIATKDRAIADARAVSKTPSKD